MSTNPLSGRVVAVTGAARGIGYATATHLRSLGAKLAIGDIDEAAAISAADSLDGDAMAFAVDISDEDSFASFLSRAESALGPIDVLVNNAGIMPIGPFLDQGRDIQRRAFEINVFGVLNGMRAVLPGMIERGTGTIVNVASSAAKAPVPGGLIYGATKAAVASLTETARVEFACAGIRFSCILPGFTDTELIVGTKGLRGFPTVKPGDVAQAIAATIQKPEPERWVPAIMGRTVAVQPLIPHSVRDRINRALGAYDAFLDVDQTARQTYDDRIEHN